VSPLVRALLEELRDDPETLSELAHALADYLPNRASEDRWMDTRDAAAYLGLKPNALHKLTASRSVPFSQDVAGGKCWFQKSQLDAWRQGRTLTAVR
jgi:hypothetical protein